METLHQIFMTVIAAFVFFFLIAKIASSVTNGDEDDHQRRRIRDISKVLAEELNSKMEKSSRKRNNVKKVRFAVDHDVTLVNKVVTGPSETKQVMFENNHDEEMISFNDVGSVVPPPEEVFGGVEKADYDDNQSRSESASPIVVNYDQTKEGDTDSIDQNSSEATVIPDQNAATGNKDLMSVKLLCDDGIEKNHEEETISLSDVRSVEEFVGVENSESDNDNNKSKSVSPSVVDYDQTKEGNTELVDQKSSQCPMIPDQNASIDIKHHMCTKLMCDDDIDESEKENQGLISEEEDSDDDWEGIERSDLEKVFAMAAEYGKEDEHLQSLGSDIQMQFYGLHKVATEGPCHEAQPMALKLSARSKWNAWQKLGNMDPDVAMERYITLLSEKVPEWSQGIYSLGADLSSSSTTSTPVISRKERKSEIESCCDVDDSHTEANYSR